MSITTRYLGPLSALVLLAGCASASLHLNLAVYKEDPNAAVALTPEQIDAMIADLDAVARDANTYAQSRTKLAADLVGVLTAFSTLRGRVVASADGRVYTPEQAKNDQLAFRQYLPAYDEAVGARLAAVERHTEEAKTALLAYRELLEPTKPAAKPAATAETAKGGGTPQPSLQTRRLRRAAQTAARSSVEMVAMAVQQLTGNLNTDLERTLRRDPVRPTVPSLLERFAGVMTPDVLGKLGASEADRKAVTELETQLEQLQATIRTLDAQGIKIADQTRNQLAVALQTLRKGLTSEAVDETASALRDVGVSPPRSAVLDQKTAALTASKALMWSQIERLQNPADPVWRIVTDPANAAKWNETFSKTYFYAEGNTSVCIVRDSPIEFRVQQGANNPAALVQAQLQVSRAVGNAALTVAGAAAGIDLSLPAPQTKPDQTGAESDAEKLARRRATVQEEAAVRAAEVRGLVITLRNFRAQLTDLPDGPVPVSVTTNLIETLQGYQKVLQAPSK